MKEMLDFRKERD